jgi:hypothetical protein
MRRIRIHRRKVQRDRHWLAVLTLDPRHPDILRAIAIGRPGEAPASADAFADHFQPWFDRHIRLIQPQLPTWSATRRSGIARRG